MVGLHSHVPSRGRRRKMRAALVGAAAAAALGLAGWGPSTYYDHRTGWVFDPSGTPLDCAQPQAPGAWRGLAGGNISLGPGETRTIAREACFPSRAACEYWRLQMSGALTRITTNSCRPV